MATVDVKNQVQIKYKVRAGGLNQYLNFMDHLVLYSVQHSLIRFPQIVFSSEMLCSFQRYFNLLRKNMLLFPDTTSERPKIAWISKYVLR